MIDTIWLTDNSLGCYDYDYECDPFGRNPNCCIKHCNHTDMCNAEFPEGITNLDGLQYLKLNHNMLSGIIPYNIGDMYNLKYLHLDNNFPITRDELVKKLDEENIEKSMTAPAITIISYDAKFYEKLPYLFPHTNAKSWYEGKPDKINSTAQMNATLQGAYFIMAARSVGLDCGPMGGFNNETLDAEFFPDMLTKSIFICGIGYGDQSKVFPRLPRLSFDKSCEVI